MIYPGNESSPDSEVLFFNHLRKLAQQLVPVESDNTLQSFQQFEDRLMYALENHSEEKFDDVLKQQAITVRFPPNKTPAIVVAAKRGKLSAVRLLLNFGADIQSCDDNKYNALHWAAHNGHLPIIKHLLFKLNPKEEKEYIESREYKANTALMLAVREGHASVVELLLKKKARVTPRNSDSMNIFDIAIKKHPELVDTILMHGATLSLEEQLKLIDDRSENIIFHAAQYRPHLFDKVVSKVLEQSNLKSRHDICNMTNEKKANALILAAKIGADKNIDNLLVYGKLEINSVDSDKHTALHWAAGRGHISIVRTLLNKGAFLEPQGFNDETPLNVAVMQGQATVVEYLLEKKANVNARNKNNMNALDIAIQTHPELVDTILTHVETLTLEQQAQCLENISEGLYKSVSAYREAYPDAKPMPEEYEESRKTLLVFLLAIITLPASLYLFLMSLFSVQGETEVTLDKSSNFMRKP